MTDHVNREQVIRALVEQLRVSFQHICRNDGTVYQHHQRRKFDNAPPSTGSIWLTPREIAESAIRRIDAALLTADAALLAHSPSETPQAEKCTQTSDGGMHTCPVCGPECRC
jgi:hypothetical protein